MAQNDDGRFVANAYITILGRAPAVHVAGMNPPGIDFGGWDWYLHGINVSADGFGSRNGVINSLIAPADAEYQNLKAAYVAGQAGYPNTCTGSYAKPPFPSSSDSNYEHELFLFMAYWYGLKRCPDAPGGDFGYTYWLTRLDQNIFDYGSFLTQFCNSSEYRTGSQPYNPLGHDAAVSTVLAAWAPQSTTGVRLYQNPDYYLGNYLPTPTAAWFNCTGTPPMCATRGGSDSTTANSYDLYRVDFTDLEGSAEFSIATVQMGPSQTYTNSCSIQFLPNPAGQGTVNMLNDIGGVVAYGSIGAAGTLIGPHCSIDLAASSAPNPGAMMSLFLRVSFFAAGTNNLFGAASALTGTVGGTWSSSLGSVVVSSSSPVLTVAKSHTGNFFQGQAGAIYTVVVTNQSGAANTNGVVTVTEAIPSGLSLVSMAGLGWACGGEICSRNDVLFGGTSYPPITVTTNVSASAPPSVTNQATVSGGGAPTATAADVTVIAGPPDFSIVLAPSNSMIPIGGSAVYTATISPINGFSGTVSLGAVAPGLIATVIPPTITAAGSAVVTVTSNSSTPVGTYPTTVTGTSGTLSHSALSNSYVVDFTIQPASQSPLAVQPGGISTYSFLVYTSSPLIPLTSYPAPIILSAFGLPAGTSATFAPSTLVNQVSSVLTITTTAGTLPSLYTFLVTGQSGSVTHSVSATLNVVSGPPALSGPHNSASVAFWYLGGHASIDEYYVQWPVCLTPNTSNATPVITWTTDSPSRLAITPTTSIAACDGKNGAILMSLGSSAFQAGYDIHITVAVDGLSSDPFPVFIDTPLTMTTSSPGEFCLGGVCGCALLGQPVGYANVVDHAISDLIGLPMQPITVKESLEKQQYLNATYGALLANPEATPWHASDWSGSTFQDLFSVCEPAWFNTLVFPLLTSWNPNGTSVIFNETQKFWVGSAVDFQGVCVQRGVVTLYTDHGSLFPYYTPIVNKPDCSPGTVIN